MIYFIYGNKLRTKQYNVKLRLLDLAVEKAGDLHKWINTRNINYVLGIDIVNDNITNEKHTVI